MITTIYINTELRHYWLPIYPPLILTATYCFLVATSMAIATIFGLFGKYTWKKKEGARHYSLSERGTSLTQLKAPTKNLTNLEKFFKNCCLPSGWQDPTCKFFRISSHWWQMNFIPNCRCPRGWQIPITERVKKLHSLNWSTALEIKDDKETGNTMSVLTDVNQTQLGWMIILDKQKKPLLCHIVPGKM